LISKWKLGMKIVCISDSHNHHRELKVPDGELLIHAGDFTYFGKEEHVSDFNAWLGELPHPNKIVVAGNHESGLKRMLPKIPITNATLLNQSGVVVNGLKIFGTDFFWPAPSGNPYFDQIPDDTDILISHGPPKGYFDDGYGCPSLLDRVKIVKPKLHVFGHIHQGHGMGNGQDELKNTIFVNAAICEGGYVVKHEPIVVNLDF